MINTTIHAELPPKLLAEAQAFVEEGRARNLNDLIADALRRYMESHSPGLEEAYMREDIEWGLRGNDRSTTGADNVNE